MYSEVELYLFNKYRACNQLLEKKALGATHSEMCQNKKEFLNFEMDIRNERIVIYRY